MKLHRHTYRADRRNAAREAKEVWSADHYHPGHKGVAREGHNDPKPHSEQEATIVRKHLNDLFSQGRS